MANTPPVESYNAILNRMSNLEDLTTFIANITKGKSDQTATMLKLIASMSTKVNDVREKISQIKSGSLEVGNRIKEVIQNSEVTQKATLQKIKESITNLGNIQGLDNALKGLDNDVSLLIEKAIGNGSGSTAAPPVSPNGNQGAATPGNNTQLGGYTYGRSSHRRGNGRKRRAKKTKRKIHRK